MTEAQVWIAMYLAVGFGMVWPYVSTLSMGDRVIAALTWPMIVVVGFFR